MAQVGELTDTVLTTSGTVKEARWIFRPTRLAWLQIGRRAPEADVGEETGTLNYGLVMPELIPLIRPSERPHEIL